MKLGLIWTLALAAVSGACASTGAVPRPFPVPGAAAKAPPANVPDANTVPPGAAPVESAPAEPSLPPPPLVSRSNQIFDSYALVGAALSLRGTPYRNGGTDPSGFDCSGFTQYVFSRFGISLPRDVRAQYRIGNIVEPSDLEAGDLVFFVTTDRDVSHVAIAIGGDEFVHAPSSSGVVRVEHIGSSYWSQRYAGARRIAP
jgi:cell wall-associated NlpC family hydrolase